MIERRAAANGIAQPRLLNGVRRFPSVLHAPGRDRARDFTQAVRRMECEWRWETGDRGDDRINVRIDGRVSEPASAAPGTDVGLMTRPVGLPPGNATELRNDEQASVSHPHGEALGPGARSDCAGREKHAFGGTRSQVLPCSTMSNEKAGTGKGSQVRMAGSSDPC